mmetsp:Transcript_8723/g.14687  ORF Transcript_8723/g.14687 Transcript_8723/m.14687 type:complete len:390 (-) Transcript_8723:732-1901(-)
MVETAEVQSICCSLAMGRLRCAASSASVGVREYLCDSSRFALRSELTRSCMCTGSRIVREWSAMARVIACRIHHVAYVERRKPRAASNFSAALISPIEPSWIRSCSVSPWFMYFFAIETTRRRLAETSSCFAFCMRCCSRTYSAAPPARPRSAAHSSFVGTRSSRSVRAPRASSHCSSCCTAADRWLTSSGESSRCLPMFLRYQRIESSPLPAVEKTGSGGPPLAASGAGAGAGAHGDARGRGRRLPRVHGQPALLHDGRLGEGDLRQLRRGVGDLVADARGHGALQGRGLPDLRVVLGGGRRRRAQRQRLRGPADENRAGRAAQGRGAGRLCGQRRPRGAEPERLRGQPVVVADGGGAARGVRRVRRDHQHQVDHEGRRVQGHRVHGL